MVLKSYGIRQEKQFSKSDTLSFLRFAILYAGIIDFKRSEYASHTLGIQKSQHPIVWIAKYEGISLDLSICTWNQESGTVPVSMGHALLPQLTEKTKETSTSLMGYS
jgi:hypothetical protein